MLIKIYFQDKPLFITGFLSDELQGFKDQNGTICFYNINESTITELMEGMSEPKNKVGILVYEKVNVAFNTLKKRFKFIRAAGGLVISDHSKILLIFRRGKWDLPKGKLDKGESIENCAVREVEEETGIKNVKITEPLLKTYHTYFQANKLILKESHWYLMNCNEDQSFKPQIDEDIEACEWVSVENLSPYLQNIHASIKDVIKAGIEKLNKQNSIQTI